MVLKCRFRYNKLYYTTTSSPTQTEFDLMDDDAYLVEFFFRFSIFEFEIVTSRANTCET